MPFSFPVELTLNGRRCVARMGPFEHSTEREFQLVIGRQALKECQDKEQLREVAGNLLEGWAALKTAFASLMEENLRLRQALDSRDKSLEAAETLINEADQLLRQYEQQLKRAKWRLWPFGR